ncbi:MAG: SDR family oxidoreductase [Acidobacteria bacterium]|nr:SDR family oxidoreductase [Acidobacteriota bacterium]
MLLQDKVAVITGGAAGIGAAIVQLFAEEGAHVFVLDRTSGEAVLTADVRSRTEVQRAVDEVLRREGRIDVLVNNAGIYPRQDFLSMTEQQWDETLDVNLKGMFHCTQAVAPAMTARRGGKIVNVASINFYLGVKRLVHYTAAKGGVIGFTRALAREFGTDNVHVNCIAPGAIETEGEPNFVNPAQVSAMVAQQCLQRRILPIDVARACVFLASYLGDGMTGQTLAVDGGWVMH